MDAVAEIKSRISIEELVGQYVALKKAGRQFKALCPFHKERTPSFYVSPERQIAYCFGCRKGGDHFQFIQEMEGLDFRGALAYLADRAGVQLPKASPLSHEKKTERDRLLDMHEDAAAFYEKQLWESSEAEIARKYLKKREMKEETVRAGRLGYAPADGAALYAHLLEKNYTRGEILTAGLALARDTDQSVCFDRFRCRLMFPIQNLAGSLCAFGGRVLREDDEPKYLNSPETPVYQKNALLYGLASARAAIRSANRAVIVEGYMDALSCHEAGFENVVACSGTALTENQLAALKRFTKDIVLSLDCDNAGKMATMRSLELGFTQELSLSVAVWKNDAKDPDECLKKDREVFAEALQSPIPAQSYILQSLEKQFNIHETSGKRQFVEEVFLFVARMPGSLEQEDWLKKISALIGSSLPVLYDELKRFQAKKNPQNQWNAPQQRRAAVSSDSLSEVSSSIKIQEYLIGLLLTYSELIPKVIQLVPEDIFEDKQLQNIYRFLLTQYNQNLKAAPLSSEEETRANIVGMYVEQKLSEAPWEIIEKEAEATLKALRKISFEREKRQIVSRLRSATSEEKKPLLERYQKLLDEEVV